MLRLGSRDWQGILVPVVFSACLWGIVAIFGARMGIVFLRMFGLAISLALTAAIAWFSAPPGSLPLLARRSLRLLAGGVALLAVGSLMMTLREPFGEQGAALFAIGVVCLVYAAMELVREVRSRAP